MGAPNLVPRVLDYFDRQIAWMREALRELGSLSGLADEDSLDRLAEQQRRREAQYEHFSREYRGLIDEWNRAEDVSEEDKREVRERARLAQAVAAELAESYERGAALLDQEKDRHRRAIQALQRGRNMTGKYRTDSGTQPDFMDRDA